MKNNKLLTKELLYRSQHRGCKETDILLGDFAAAELEKMGEQQLLDYQELIAQEDVNIFSWLTGQAKCPANLNHELIDRICEFHRAKHAK